MKAAYGGLSAFVKAASGIVLEEGKEYLVESRLAPVARQFGAPDVPRLVEKLEATRDPALSRAIVEALTTNETYFFRDRAPFDLFIRNILPEVMKARADERVIRIWCAACATGQEPYSLAMLLDEASRQLTGWRVELLATDISTAALEAARAASYNQFEVQRGLPVNMLLRYFTQEDQRWRLVQHLRQRVEFRELNLVHDFRGIGPFDIVFCRNVLIYFDADTRKQVLSRLARVCRPDAYLWLGAAESVIDHESEWRPHDEFPLLNVRTSRIEAPARRLSLVASR